MNLITALEIQTNGEDIKCSAGGPAKGGRVEKCHYIGCENEAEFWDWQDNRICAECMERELAEDPDLDETDFEPLIILTGRKI